MALRGKTAIVTGGASGIGRAAVEMLVSKGARVYILDRDVERSQRLVNDLHAQYPSDPPVAKAFPVDIASWNSQATAFVSALAECKRIDYVIANADIGERLMFPNEPSPTGFQEPDLGVLDVDLNGVLFTASLGIQQFRRQEPDENGFRGKIITVASVCGFYCVPVLPVYTAAKHGVVGFVRSFGHYLPSEGITLNAICPNVVQTNISRPEFYEEMTRLGLLVPMETVVGAFESLLLGANATSSGEVLECGPKGSFVVRQPPEYLDDDARRCCEMLQVRGRKLLYPLAR